MNSDNALLAAIQRAAAPRGSYRLRVPLNSTIDKTIRGYFGSRLDGAVPTAEQYVTRKMYKYSGVGKYKKRRTRKFRGRGLYMGGSGGYWGRRIGGLFGQAALGDKIGDLVGSGVRSLVPHGNMIMNAANAAGKVFAGQGDYVENDLVGEGGPIPSFTATPDGNSVRICHKEYIGDVFAPPTGEVFQNTAYSINPGIERTFPWLSQIAANYDEYTIHQLMFTYRSTVADFASNSGQVGQVIMSTIYNAANEPFSDKQQMMQYDATMSCKTSETMIHGVECDPNKLSGAMGRFVRVNPVLVGQDINQYDHGLFNIAVTETPATYANQAMGELWIAYTIELRKPKFFSNRGLAISRDVFVCPTAQDTKHPFGFQGSSGNLLLGQQNNIGCVLTQYDSGGTAIPGILNPLNGDANNLVPGPSTGQPWFYAITFPANYTGNLKLTMTMSIPGGAAQSGYYAAYGQGNIFPINDMFATDSNTWKNYWTSGNNTSRTAIQIWDLRITSATNGVDNTIFFAFNDGHFEINNCMLDISEYNMGLSYKQDGSRDALILADPSGQIVNP